MKIHNPLDKILNNEIKVRILRQLCKTEEESSGRQIAKEIKISPAACHKALQGLYQQRVLNFKNIGNTYLYSLNNKNIIVDTLIKPAFKQELRIPDIISSIIEKGLSKKVKQKIITAAVFGSVAKGKEKASSDIDLLIVIRDSKDKNEIENAISGISSKILNEFGNTISLYIQARKEFKTKYNNKLPVILNILNSYKLVFGKSLEEILT